MNIRSIYNIIFAALFLAFANGCLMPKPVGEESPDNKKGEEQGESRFDPFELPADKEIVPELYPVSGELNLAGNLIVSGNVQGDANISNSNILISTEIDTANSQAFRIQILTSKVYGDVRRAKIVAEEIFDRPVYIDYEVPYYKIRVGSFDNRDEAEDYMQQVRMAGYSDAWVVVTNVAVKSLSPLYDDEPLPEEIESDVSIEKTVTDE